MKAAFQLMTLVFCIALCSPTFAQSGEEMSKAELKALKKSIKQKFVKNPQAYKDMIDKYNSRIDGLEDDKAKLQTQLSSAQKAKSEAETKAESTEAQLEATQSQLAEANAELEKAKSMASTAGGVPSTGIAYAVQIGYYKKFDISSYFMTPKAIGSESADGGNRYVITYFTSEDEAQQFAEDMQRMGIEDAWVVHYQDGIRVDKDSKEPLDGDIEDVMESETF